MRLLFWRHPEPSSDSEARRAAEAAKDLLVAVRGNRRKVQEDVAWLRAKRDRNHLTELFRGGNS